MLAVARSVSQASAIPIEWYHGSALALPFDEGEFGVVLCQFGLQFFPDPAMGLREMRRVLAPEGRMGVSVFAEIERNPVAHAFSDTLDRRLGEGASGAKRKEHAVANQDALRLLFRKAGFTHIVIETVAKTSRYPSVSDYVRFQLQATPLADVLTRYDQSDRDRLTTLLVEELGGRLAPFARDGGLAFPQVAHIATTSG